MTRRWSGHRRATRLRGDNTKVRKLSDSRSYGDGARRRQSTEKLCFAIEISNQAAVFHLGTTTRCPPRYLPVAQSTRINAQRLKLSNLDSLEPDNSDTFVFSPHIAPRASGISWRTR